MHALIFALAETEERAPLILPAWVFPLIAALAFLFFAIVTWTYRDVANRHSDKVPNAAPHDEHDAGQVVERHGGGH